MRAKIESVSEDPRTNDQTFVFVGERGERIELVMDQDVVHEMIDMSLTRMGSEYTTETLVQEYRSR